MGFLSDIGIGSDITNLGREVQRVGRDISQPFTEVEQFFTQDIPALARDVEGFFKEEFTEFARDTGEFLGITDQGKLSPPTPIGDQSQRQAVSTEQLRKIIPAIKQFESTTGRNIQSETIEGLSRAQLTIASDRATQDFALALQAKGLDAELAFRLAEQARSDRAATAGGIFDLFKAGVSLFALF